MKHLLAIKSNQIRYELVSVKPLLNRSVLSITCILVAPEFTVEPRDVWEYGHSASRDSPTSNLLYNSLLSYIRMNYSTKFKRT